MHPGRLLVIPLLAATATAQAEIRLPPARDNTLFEDPTGPRSSGAGPTMFAGVNGQGLIRRSLVAFDVQGRIPAGSTVVAADLTATLVNAQPPTQAVTLHRVTPPVVKRTR